MTFLQRISKDVTDEQDLFEKYFHILLIVNSLHLPPAEIKLLAFTARKGNISSGGLKNQFCELTSYPKASLGNLIHKLTKKNWLVKKDDRIVVNPAIEIQPSDEIVLKIKLNAKREVDKEDSSRTTAA